MKQKEERNQIPSWEMCKKRDENVCYNCMRYDECIEKMKEELGWDKD